MLSPGQKIGILGGGQLGRMLAQAAARFGFEVTIYCPEPNPPAAAVASHHICADYDDRHKLTDFIDRVDCVTYEFENIPVDTVRFLAEHKAVWPDAQALEVSQDRLNEKQFIQSLGIPVAPFFAIDDRAALATRLMQLGGAAILKTRRMGYDGKGQWRLNGQTDLDAVWAEAGHQPLIMEAVIPFIRELSVIIGRSVAGDLQAYDPVLNVHRNHILHTSTVPAPIDDPAAKTAGIIGETIISALQYVGILTIELFMTDEGFVVNEIAPRVHNSGHWTLDACITDQFTQHIRAIAGWPLSTARRHSDAQMTNLIGSDIESWATLIAEPDHCLHLYGKSEAKAGRKMGHVTRVMPLGTLDDHISTAPDA